MQKLNPEVTFIFFIKNCLKMLFVYPVWLIFQSILEHVFNVEPLFFDAVGLLLLLSFILIGYFWAWLTYTMFSYQLNPDGLKIEKGILIRKNITIPYNRIANVEYYLNPVISQVLGIYNLHIATEEVENTQGVIARAKQEIIPGLTHEAAESLKGKLISLAHQQIPHRKYVNLETGQYQ